MSHTLKEKQKPAVCEEAANDPEIQNESKALPSEKEISSQQVFSSEKEAKSQKVLRSGIEV